MKNALGYCMKKLYNKYFAQKNILDVQSALYLFFLNSDCFSLFEPRVIYTISGKYLNVCVKN